MAIWSRTSVMALRTLLPNAARLVAEATGCSFAAAGVDAIERHFVAHFSDPSRRLPQALSRAADRAWRALEVAVAGESLWSKMVRQGEDKAYSADLRAFLDANPLRLTSSQDAAFRRQVCEEFQAARKAGLIPGTIASTDALAKPVAELARFGDPGALCAAEWQAVALISIDLRAAGHNAIAELLDLRADHTQPPLLALAVRFFFRREVETSEQLFRGLVYEQVDDLRQEVHDGLSGLLATLETHEGWLAGLLAVAEDTRDNVLDLKAEQARQGSNLQALYAEVVRQGEKLDRLHERALRPSDSLSIRGETERQLVRQVVEKYRTISEEQRRQLPALLDAVGKLELAAGEYQDAQRDFQQQAEWAADRQAKAAAHFGAYLAALERHEWPAALEQLQQAMRLDPQRWELFPSAKFAPERILGAGGFGVVFLCRDVDSGARVAVKALRTDELERESKAVIAEAEQLEDIEHENIIRLRTAGFADPGKARPFLVMSYFDGVTLEEHVRGHGSLPLREVREVARQVAAGLMAAHARNILHRDVKPGNVLVRRVAEGPAADGAWQVKLIDFGLALRRQAVLHTLSNADALAKTARGQSIAGTMDYAAPEQLGKLAGASVGPHSDVYGFGKTLCFAAFGTPQPGPRHWRTLDDHDFGELLGQCIEERPEARPQSLAEVLGRLRPSSPAVKESPQTERLLQQEEAKRQEKDEAEQQAKEAEPQAFAVAAVQRELEERQRRKVEEADRQAEAEREQREAERRRNEERARQAAEERRAEAARQRLRLLKNGLGLAAVLAIVLVAGWGLYRVGSGIYQWFQPLFTCTATLTGHEGEIRSLTFSPNGEVLASGSDDGLVKLWDPKLGKERFTLKGHTRGLSSVSFSLDGEILASGSDDGTVRLWGVQTGGERGVLKGHTGFVSSVSFNQVDKTLASGSKDKIILWDIQTKQPRLTLDTKAGFEVCFSPDGKTLASSSGAGSITLWDAQTGKKRATLVTGGGGAFPSLSFSGDGNTLACLGSLREIILWNLRTETQRLSFAPDMTDRSWLGGAGMRFVCLAPDGKTLATDADTDAASDNTLKLYDVYSEKEIARLKGHSKRVSAACFAPDGNTMATGSRDCTIRLWSRK